MTVQVIGRILQLKKLLISRFLSLKSHFPRSDQKIKYSLWFDGTNCEHGIVIGLLQFLMDDPSQSKDICKPLLFGIWNINETKEWYELIASHVFPQISGAAGPFQINGQSISFAFRLLKGDLSFLRKILGSASAGHLRCGFCTMNFHDGRMILFEYHWTHVEKTITWLCDTPEKQLAEFNCKRPAFLPSKSSLLSEENLADFEIAFDALHMMKGLLAGIYECITACKGLKFEFKTFSIKFEEAMSKRDPNDLPSSGWRKFFLLYEECIVPFVDKPYQDLIRQICQLANDLSYLLFVPSNPTINQRYRYLISSFVLFDTLSRHSAFSKLLNSCYLHYLCSHMAKRYFNCKLENSFPQQSTDL